MRISVVTPTLHRPAEVGGLLANLRAQRRLPLELVLVDGAEEDERRTEQVVAAMIEELPYSVCYLRQRGGTAIQRNHGIEKARGELIAFVDDDVRLDPGFLEIMEGLFKDDRERRVGGIVGYRTNKHFSLEESPRWRWYRRLGLLTVFEPGRYDRLCGYPINANLQPPFSGVREVDFMTTACAVWRAQVFDEGLRFDEFFRDYGVLEDAHLALRAGRRWRLLQCGDALCEELSAAGGREDRYRIGYKCVVNYRYVFGDVYGPLSLSQRARFWRFQAFEIIRLLLSSVRRLRAGDLADMAGRLRGALAVATGGVPVSSGRSAGQIETRRPRLPLH